MGRLSFRPPCDDADETTSSAPPEPAAPGSDSHAERMHGLIHGHLNGTGLGYESVLLLHPYKSTAPDVSTALWFFSLYSQ